MGDKRKEPRFVVEAGRQIYRDGKPFISIHREGLGGPTEDDSGPTPTEADELTHIIAALLNKLGRGPIVTTYLKPGRVSKLVGKIDDRDNSPVEFTESEAGYRARDRWAERYDDLNGAPESDDDR